MTAQEAIMKHDIKRKNNQLTYNELYFPNLRDTIFNILSGNEDTYEKLVKDDTTDMTPLKNAYIQAMKVTTATSRTPIQAEFVDDGITLSLVVKDEVEQNVSITIHEYVMLKWEKDNDVLVKLAKALNAIVLSYARMIPNLFTDKLSYRLVHTIETNPLFDQMAFVYAIYRKLNMHDTLFKGYIQCLLLKRRITYPALCSALKFSTSLPSNVTDWFTAKDIIKRHTYSRKVNVRDNVNTNQDNQENQEQDEQIEIISYMALFLIDYSGATFNHQLKIQASKRAEDITARYITIEESPDMQ